MTRYWNLFFLTIVICNIAGYSIYCQVPELTIDQREFSICQGDVALVVITISEPAPVFVEYVFEEDTFIASSTQQEIFLELFDPGIYNIIRFGNSIASVIDVEDSIVVIEFPAPEVYFTGGGSVCSSEEPVPLTAHFKGVPPFILSYLINGQPDTIYENDSTYTFPVEQSIFIITINLADNNCQIDTMIEAQFVLIDVLQPVIYGDSVFCESDNTIYSTDQSNFSAEWHIPEGADYVEGVNSEGSFISVTWTESGTHEVRLRLYDEQNQCTSLWSTLPVTVYERPEVVELIDTAMCLELEEYLLLEIPVGSDETVFWPELGITGAVVEIDHAGTYTFIVSNQRACSDTGTLILVDNCICDIHVPEAFTPNGDQINDYLEIFGMYEEFELSIFSPSGILLFSMTTNDPPWDGTTNGNPVPAGSYYWSTTFKGLDGIPLKKTGVVTLIR